MTPTAAALACPPLDEADERREILVERFRVRGLLLGVPLETDLLEVVLVLLEFYRRRMPSAPAGTLDNDLEHVSAHGEPPSKRKRQSSDEQYWKLARPNGREKGSGDRSHPQGTCPCDMFLNSEIGSDDGCGCGSHLLTPFLGSRNSAVAGIQLHVAINRI